jgi:GAF domain-containing protein
MDPIESPAGEQGTTIGAINVHHREQHEHTPNEIAAVTCIGEQTGGAIAKHLLEEVNARLGERDRKLEEQHQQLEEEVAHRRAGGRQPGVARSQKRGRDGPPQERVSGQHEA